MKRKPAVLGGAPLFPDGPPSWPFPDARICDALAEAAADGSWGRYHGPCVPELEHRLRELHQAESVILCSSGTAAVELALRGCKVGPEDEVILAGYDFPANFRNVLILGARPVLVDIRRDNLGLDVDRLAAALSPKTRALVVSHLHGGVVDMPGVRAFADEHGLAVVEDACQMPAARIHGRTAGTWGDAGVLSFGGSKLLTAGRGGAVVTSDRRIAQRIRLYTARGNEAYPLSELQARVLLPQLDQLDECNRKRADSVARLIHALHDVPGLQPITNPLSDSSPGFYKLGFWYDRAAFDGLSREGFTAAMRAEGIAIDAGFRALDRIHLSRRFRKADKLEIAGEADRSIVVLHHPILLAGSAGEMERIAEAVETIRRHADVLVRHESRH